MDTITYREALVESMEGALVSNPNAFIYGLGVTDYIGIFGTVAGLQEKYGEKRVFDTPIAEDAMTGFALGASLSGLYPIHIHIRVDFMLLAMNQLVNSIAKYKYMYGGLYEAPMLIRGIIGRSWGQGAQHSQSLQAMFAHVPGLTVIMPSNSEAVVKSYDYAVNKFRGPVISLEHRLLYNYNFNKDDNKLSPDNPFDSYIFKKGEDVTIIGVSIMVEESYKASQYIKENYGIDAEIIDLNCISHPNMELIIESLKKTGRLIVVDSGWNTFGVGAEITRRIAEMDPTLFKVPVQCLGMADAPCPTAKRLENDYYPDIGNIADAILISVYGPKHGKALPDEEYIQKLTKEFKGPF